MGVLPRKEIVGIAIPISERTPINKAHGVEFRLYVALSAAPDGFADSALAAWPFQIIQCHHDPEAALRWNAIAMNSIASVCSNKRHRSRITFAEVLYCGSGCKSAKIFEGNSGSGLIACC